MSTDRSRRLPWLFAITALVILLDRLSKNWVRSHIELGQAIPVIPRVFRITHVLNDGAAFSLFADSASPNHIRWGLIAFSSIAALAILVALIRMGKRFTLTTISLAMILGGALGNDYDRVRFASVIDFLEVHIFSYHWPDFNVADSAIVVGACLLMLDVLLPDKHEKLTNQGRIQES
jgi:signal peptidase II